MADAADHSQGRPEDRKRGPYANGIQRRKQILDNAVAVFGERGYAGGSLRDIAERVGVTAPAIIRHFGTKEGLLTATLARSEERMRGDAHGRAYLETWAALPAENVEKRGLVQLLLTVATEASNPSHPAHEFMVERYRKAVESLREELREAARQGDVGPLDEAQLEAEARGFVALMDGLELQWLLDPSMDLVGTHEYHFRLMIDRLTAGQSRLNS